MSGLKNCVHCGKTFLAPTFKSTHCGDKSCARLARLGYLKDKKESEDQLTALEHFALREQFPSWYDIVQPICYGVMGKKRRCLKCREVRSFDNGARICRDCRESNKTFGRLAQ